MSAPRKKFSTIDEYINDFPDDIKEKLTLIRNTIKELVPEAEEAIAYQIPTFRLNGNLVHFAGYKKHIGFYPTPSAIVKFEKELTSYEKAKGSIKFPLNVPLPIDLITEMVKFRVQENLEKAKKPKQGK